MCAQESIVQANPAHLCWVGEHVDLWMEHGALYDRQAHFYSAAHPFCKLLTN